MIDTACVLTNTPIAAVTAGRSAEELHRLFVAHHRSPRPALRNELVRCFLPFGRRLALCYAHHGVAPENLGRVWLASLVRSIERFDPGQGVEFTAFAGPVILDALERHVRSVGAAPAMS